MRNEGAIEVNKKPIPIWEVSMTLYCFYVAALLFLYPNLLNDTDYLLYTHLEKLAPQFMWSFFFVIAAVLMGGGLVFKDILPRILGLGVATILFGTIAICHMIDFPNLGSGLYSIMTFMCIMSIVYVRTTEL